MSHQNYTLEIISHHAKFSGKSLRKYYVDGIDTVGAWGNEPFEVRFKNNTYQKVQVKLSLDGTDILTGKPADTELSKDMWVVEGYGTLSLKAWPEDNNGGAAFVFTSADNSVAVHTHGDLSSRGIIAAAVFTESYVSPYQNVVFNSLPPVRITEEHHHHHYERNRPYYDSNPIWIYQNSGNAGNLIGGQYNVSNNSSGSFGGTYSSSSAIGVPTAASGDFGGMSFDTCLGDTEIGETCSDKSLVSIGAGQHVDQKIIHVAGLITPKFSEAVRVKYLWWDDLVAKLRTKTEAEAQPSGFPADKPKGIDLKDTPRMPRGGKRACKVQLQEQVFARV